MESYISSQIITWDATRHVCARGGRPHQLGHKLFFWVGVVVVVRGELGWSGGSGGWGGQADTRFTASTSYYLPLSDFQTGSTHLFSFLATFILHTSYCLYLKSNWRKSPPIPSSHPFCLHQTSTTRPFFLQQLAEVCSRWSTAPPPAPLHPPAPTTTTTTFPRAQET